MFPFKAKPSQESAAPGPLGANNRYRTALREQFEALHEPVLDTVEAQSDSDPFKLDVKLEPTRPVSQVPTPSAEKKWNDPAKKAERARRRDAAAQDRIKNLEKEFVRRLSTEAAYQEAIKQL